ncbi:hypothetical protein [Spirosoma endophyticum]|uniref:hypothetical protein n=1 Tax=Spirosoma endophyticum TaxID=662367 RepID=UPI001C435078|nr:hypothetical protein [Spirosoma endophyticum]
MERHCRVGGSTGLQVNFATAGASGIYGSAGRVAGANGDSMNYEAGKTFLQKRSDRVHLKRLPGYSTLAI